MRSIRNGNVTKEDLVGKYIFWGIDGTLAPLRFNNHVSYPTEEEVEDSVFLLRNVSRHMQFVVNDCKSARNIILGHAGTEREIADKNTWLNIYFTNIKERLFISWRESKGEKILEYCKENSIPLSEVAFVDDTIEILQEVEKLGITAFHVSSFMDWQYQ